MSTWIALFRGVNVGGNNIMPMKELRQAFEIAGFPGVQTYIQSGNVVFSADSSDKDALTETIGAFVADAFGFTPKTMLLTESELNIAIAKNPFPLATQDPKKLHLFFLRSPSSANLAALNEITSVKEKIELTDTVFYLHAPDGVARSKIAAKAEKILGVDTTARNWNTVTKLQELARNSH